MTTMDPDAIRPSDPAYWAAALMLAVQRSDRERIQHATARLGELGYRVTVTRARRPRKPKNEREVTA